MAGANERQENCRAGSHVVKSLRASRTWGNAAMRQLPAKICRASTGRRGLLAAS